MAKPIKRVKGKKRGPIAQGDTLQTVTSVETVDVNGDGIDDLVFKHKTEINNGERGCVTASIVWENLPPQVVQAFEAAIEDSKIELGEKDYDAMKPLVKEWRKLTKLLGKINDLGDIYAAEALGE